MTALFVIGCIIAWFWCGVLSAHIYNRTEEERVPTLGFSVFLLVLGAFGLAITIATALIMWFIHLVQDGEVRRFFEKLLGVRH